MTASVVDLDRLTAAGVRNGSLAGRSVTVLGLARSGIALARFFADAGSRVTVYDGRPAAELAAAIEALGRRPVELALGPDVEPASDVGRGRPDRHVPEHQPRLPDDRAPAAGRAPGRRRCPSRPTPTVAGAWSARRTWSSECAHVPASGSRAPRARPRPRR